MSDTTESTEYRCRAANRCADRERITVTPKVCDECTCHNGPYVPCSVEGGCGHLHVERIELVGVEIPTFDGLCRLCVSHTTAAINHLPLDIAELTILMGTTGSPGDTEKIIRTPEAPIPIRVSVEALRAEIDHELAAWAEPVAEQLGITWDTAAMRHTRIGHRAQRAANLLAAATDTLVALPPLELPAWRDGEPVWDHELGVQDTIERDGITGALHLSHLHRLAYAVLGRTHLVHHLLPRCEHCGQRALVRHDGEEDARCESDRCRGRVVPAGRINWLVMATTAVEQAVRRHEQTQGAA